MKINILVTVLLLATAAHAREERLPVPPIPPIDAPGLAAPMPNQTVFSVDRDQRRSNVTLFTGLNHRADPSTGFGYAPGTHYQLDNDRRFMLPGVMLHVPLP
jgi:hypothetical protein